MKGKDDENTGALSTSEPAPPLELQRSSAAAAAGGAPPSAALSPGKKRACDSGGAAEADCVQVLPLGAGCEVGRSCVVVSFGNMKVMFDCGVHPAHSGIGALPLFDGEDVSKVDVCLITHFHLDHCGALPYLLTKTGFRGRVFMTQPTRLIARLLWHDYARMGRLAEGEGGGVSLFSEEDIEYTLQVVETLDFRQQVQVGEAKISCYGAGHVVGACMFVVEVGGVRVLYTGDFSREKDRHVPVAEVPQTDVHVLISESTYGVHVHEARPLRERRLIKAVVETVTRGGKVLMPVFALGRAQELLLILDEHWTQQPLLHRIPIFFVSPLSAKSMAVFEAFVDMCGEELRNRALQGDNPFHLRHVRTVGSLEQIASSIHGPSPCVLLAAPGMLQAGASREAFEAWAGSRQNLVLLTGYTVRGTLADELRKDQEVLQLADRQLRRRCLVEVISFSAHSDYMQTRDFVSLLRVPNVVLVHGERSEMKRLQEKLVFENPALSVFTPEILQTVALHFKPNRCAVALGDAANKLQQLLPHKPISCLPIKHEQQQQEQQQEGEGFAGCVDDDWDSLLLLQQGQQPLLVAAAETESLTGIACATLQQKIRTPFPRPLSCLMHAAADVFDDVQPLKCTCSSGSSKSSSSSGSSEGATEEAVQQPVECCCAFLVAGCVSVRRVPKQEHLNSPAAASAADAAAAGPCCGAAEIEVSWLSSPTADLVADSVLFLSCDLLRLCLEGFPAEADGCAAAAAAATTAAVADGELLLLQIVKQHLTEQFGPVRICRKLKSATLPIAEAAEATAAAAAVAESQRYEDVLLEDLRSASHSSSSSSSSIVDGFDLCLVFRAAAEQTPTAAAGAAAAGAAAAGAAAATAAAVKSEISATQVSSVHGEEGDSVEVCVDFTTRKVECIDSAVQQRVRTLVARVEKSFLPVESPF
ncbi:hypothetical protein Esti_002125 [Eimeria stiedai]